MDEKIYGFLEEDYNKPCNSNRFIRKTFDTMEDIIKNPRNKIIYSDISQSGVYITKFLKSKNFKNAIIYHLNKNTLYNPDDLNVITYKNSDIIIKKIKENSDEIVYL